MNQIPYYFNGIIGLKNFDFIDFVMIGKTNQNVLNILMKFSGFLKCFKKKKKKKKQ